MHRLSKLTLTHVLYFSLGLCLLILAGCGSTTAGATVSSTDATATACVQATRPVPAFKTATGVLKSINGQTLIVTNNKGNDVTVTYSTATRFSQVNSVAATSLQEGTAVRIAVTSTNGSYSATSITVTTATNGTGFPRGNGTPGTGRRTNNPCAKQVQVAPPGNGTNGAKGFRGLVGIVSQLNGSTLTITEASGSSFTVTITPQTQILETQNTTSSALKVGGLLTVVGRADSQGQIVANSVTLLPNLPNATSTPTE